MQTYIKCEWAWLRVSGTGFSCIAHRAFRRVVARSGRRARAAFTFDAAVTRDGTPTLLVSALPDQTKRAQRRARGEMPTLIAALRSASRASGSNVAVEPARGWDLERLWGEP